MSESPPKEKKRTSSPYKRRVYGNEKDREDSTCLFFFGNLPYQIRENELEELCTEFGKIVNVNIGIEKKTGKSLGFGFVQFESKKRCRKMLRKISKI